MFVPLTVNVAHISLLILHILLLNYAGKKKKKTYKLVSEAQNCHDFIENVGIVILASKSISLSTSFIRVYHEKNEI